MKTLFTHFRKLASTPPAYLIVLFAWLLMPVNSYADPIAIGTGTVTLNSGNVGSNSSGQDNYTFNNETCVYIAGDGEHNADWDVTIEPGIYDIELKYGVWIYGIQANFYIIDPDNGSIVKTIYQEPLEYGSAEAVKNRNPTIQDYNLVGLTKNKTYKVRVNNPLSWSHLVVEYIKFTRTDGCASPDVASFNGGDATSGSVDNIEACAGIVFPMPDQGTMFKPGYLFTGWKLNNAGDLITAGTSYTMPAGGASFTAQWEEDNTTMRIPTTETTLNYENKTGGSSETIDFYDETSVYLYNTHYVEWDAYITPGSYQISMKYGAPYYGIRGTFSIIDPLGIESPRVFYTQTEETNGSDPIYRNPSVTYDLSSLTEGKIYTIKVEHDWSGSYLSIAHIEFTPLGANQNITFAKGDEAVTGSLPANTTCAGEGSYTLPGKGDLAWSGHSFAGWSDGSTTYAPGVSYTMPNHDVTFTAVWTPMTVPTVTNLSISAENEVVTLTYSIPGICDLSAYVDANASIMDNFNGTNSGSTYLDGVITATGESGSCGQYGIALPIPATENIETITIDCKGNVDLSSKNVKLWGGIMADGGATYWNYDDNLHWFQPTDWTERTFTIDERFWDLGSYNKSTSIKYVGVFANGPCGGTTTGISFSVRDVRYHVAGQEDIHHVVIMRKAGQDQASTGLDDGTLLEPGTRSRFVDNAAKAAGWYTYTVFAVHADGTLSAGVSTSVQIVVKEPHTVTYALGGGTGTLPTETDHVEGASFTVANGDGLSYAGHTFAGWNDGNADYAPGASYTMPDDNVTLTAQWTPFSVPTVTNLSLNGDMKTVNLSWKIPGFIDLNTAKITPSSSFSTAYSTLTYASDATVNSNGELVVTYSANGGGSITGFLFDVNLSNVEAVYYDYKGDYTGSGWDGIFPGIYCSTNSTMYWEGGSHDLKNVDWQSKEITTFTGFWKSGTYASENISELGFFANACNDAVENGHMYIRNLRYHCTGQIDIDHIVLVRKDGSEPADPMDGVVLPAGNRFAFVDADDSKEEGHTYYYKVFSVHADGSYSAPEAVYYTVPALTTYTRENLNVGDFGTICLPYAIEAANREGVELFEIDSWAEDGSSMTMSQLNADETMAAGHPYIFQATANTATFRYYEVGEPAEAGSHNGLIGSYVEFELAPNNDNYIIYQNKLYLVNSANVWCGDHRAYIHKGATTPSSAPRRRVTLSVNGEQVITDIDQINDQLQVTKFMENGILYIIRDGKIYNAQGQLVK